MGCAGVYTPLWNLITDDAHAHLAPSPSRLLTVAIFRHKICSTCVCPGALVLRVVPATDLRFFVDADEIINLYDAFDFLVAQG